VPRRNTVTVHIPVVGSRPDYGEPRLEGAPALRRYQFWARGPSRDDPPGASLIPVGIHDSETCRWLYAASGLLHDAALERVVVAHGAGRLVVNVTTRDPPGVEGRSGTLGAACGEAAARWLRPGMGLLLPVLAATGEIAMASEEVACAGEALLVRPVEGVATKLAGVAAMIAAEPAMLRGRGIVVVLPAANLQGGSDVADIRRELAALETFCAQAALDVRVVKARTLADVLAVWCPRDAWLSIKVAAQFTGAGPTSTGLEPAPRGRNRFAVIGAAGMFAALSVGVTADEGQPIVTLSGGSLQAEARVTALLPAAGLAGPPWGGGHGVSIPPNGTYLVKLNGSVIGTFVAGRGSDKESRKDKRTCFAAMVPPGNGVPDLLVTVGKIPWPARDCRGWHIELLPPSRSMPVRFGVIYRSNAVNASGDIIYPSEDNPEVKDPVVLAWTPADGLRVDAEATRRAAAAGAKTMEDLLLAVEPGWTLHGSIWLRRLFRSAMVSGNADGA